MAGHLMHLTDNLDLTFDDLVEVMKRATDNRLEKVTEKLDGQNIFFSYDTNTDTLKLARNKGDLAKGGMTREDVATKWADKENVKAAFTQAYDVLQASVGALSPADKTLLFGDAVNVWYNAEVLTTVNPNVINYDRNAVVPHELGAIRIDRSGKNIGDEGFDTTAAFDHLKSKFSAMQSVATKHGWDIIEPIIVQLGTADDRPMSEAAAALEKEAARVGVGTEATLGTYVSTQMISYAKSKSVTQDSVAQELAKRMTDAPGKIQRLPDLLKLAKTPEEAAAISSIDKAKDKLLKAFMRPIDLIINEFAIKLLANVQSAIARDPSETLKKLRNDLTGAIETLKQNPGNLDFIKAQMQKLGADGSAASSLEGVVFRYKGNSYKFTGAFAAINQILGALRFGKIPSAGMELDEGESMSYRAEMPGFKFTKKPGQKTIAMYPGAFKPFHAGHAYILEKAAEAADEVWLFVSANDRKRPKEFPLVWKDGMERVWKEFIEPSLPANVSVRYVANPVTAAYQAVEELEKSGTPVMVYMIAGDEDKSRFEPGKFLKSAPTMVNAGNIELAAPPRVGGFSGTKARQALETNNLELLGSQLPPAVQPKTAEVMQILRGAAGVLTEHARLVSLIRESVKKALKRLP